LGVSNDQCSGLATWVGAVRAAIQNAISAALDDSDFQSITFQTIEDTQRVVTSIQQQLDANNVAFINSFILHIVLLTQQTTAPDPLDPQQ
jgi:hypothetical protein